MARNPAAVAYGAYRDHMNGIDFGPKAIMLPPWEELSPEQKAAWWASVRALIKEWGG